MKKFFGILYRFIFLCDYRVKYIVTIMLWLKRHNKMKLLCFFIREGLRRKYHVIIAKDSKIGSLRLTHPHNVVIGEGCVIGNGCTLYHDVTIGRNRGLVPTLGDNVVVYSGAKIIGNVKVGNNAVIGANAVVTSDVPENAIVGGIPARVIKYREDCDEFR